MPGLMAISMSLEQLWHRVGITEVIAHTIGRRKFDFPVERALFAMIANRACAPSSKLYCFEQWLQEDVRLSGTEDFELHHLYRAMDFLEANKGAIEEAIYFRVADLFNLDVELVFYDTTSQHFEIDEEDCGVGEEDRVCGSIPAGKKTYKAPRKRVCHLRASGRYGPYIRLTKTGKAVIDRARVRARERLDGKFVVHSNDDTLNAEDLALGYKQLQRVEEAWRTLKSGLRLRPVYHYAPHRIHAHVFLTVLALLLERIAEQACAATWRNIRDDLKRIKLAQLLSPNGTVWQVTEPALDAAKRLKSLKIKNPPPIHHVD